MSVEMLQVIRAEGTYDTTLEPSLPESDLKKLYEAMILLRTLDVRALSLQRQGRIGFYIQCIGQEASQIGSAYAFEPNDWLFPSYRDAGVAIVRGLALKTLFCHLMGNSQDVMKGHQMPNHWGYRSINLVSLAAPIGVHIPVAVGVALAAKMRGDRIVTGVYFGDGATSSNDFHAGMNFAGVFHTPTIFFCQNNQYAISLPVSKQTKAQTLASKARAYGFEGVRVDGNDVLAVYKAVKEAVVKARNGGGPTVIEAITYRIGAHSTADDPKRYRVEREVEEWRKRDPIDRFRLYLQRKGIWSEDLEAKVRQQADGIVSDAIREAEKIPPPTLETMFEDVYSEMSWNLKEQLKELLSEQRDVTKR